MQAISTQKTSFRPSKPIWLAGMRDRLLRSGQLEASGPLERSPVKSSRPEKNFFHSMWTTCAQQWGYASQAPDTELRNAPLLAPVTKAIGWPFLMLTQEP